jgi:hypothetical protein
MLLNNNTTHKVLLPQWIWKEATDKDHLKKLVLQYMQRYPNYIVKRIENGFAVCERRD